jgi:hypothetical protein
LARWSLAQCVPLIGLLTLLLAAPLPQLAGSSLRALVPSQSRPTEESPTPTQTPAEEEQPESHAAPVSREDLRVSRCLGHVHRLHSKPQARWESHAGANDIFAERSGHNGCGGPLRC